MPEEYYKEIEISSWRGIIVAVLGILLILTVLITPNYLSISSYTETSISNQVLYNIPLNNNTTQMTGDFVISNGVLHSSTNNAQGYAFIKDSNKTLISYNKTLSMQFKNILLGSDTLTLTFLNTTYNSTIITMSISLNDLSSYGYVSVYVNNVPVGTKPIDILAFRVNPVINITALHYKWIVNVGNATFNITKDTLDLGNIPYIPANAVLLSGKFFWFYGLTNLTVNKVNITTTTIPVINSWTYLFISIVLVFLTALGIYYKPENYLEITFISLILLIITLNLAINMTTTIAYAVSISLIFAIGTVVVWAVDFKQIETIDEFLEKHLWKFGIMWVIIFLIWFYLYH